MEGRELQGYTRSQALQRLAQLCGRHHAGARELEGTLHALLVQMIVRRGRVAGNPELKLSIVQGEILKELAGD